MVIEPIVTQIASHYGVDPALIHAVIQAEGGGHAILRAVRCSLPNTQTREEAIKITCRSAAHAMSDYVRQYHARPFVRFWAIRWAPPGAANDPDDLNLHWPNNVYDIWIAADDPPKPVA